MSRPSLQLVEDAGVAANPVKYLPKCVKVVDKSRPRVHFKCLGLGFGRGNISEFYFVLKSFLCPFFN